MLVLGISLSYTSLNQLLQNCSPNDILTCYTFILIWKFNALISCKNKKIMCLLAKYS